MKRIREDGHLSKEEYDLQNSNSFFASSTSSKLSDHLATPGTLEGRRILTIQKNDKREKFTKLLFNLNQSFASWIKDQLQQDIYADLSDGFQDYIDYVSQLEDRYLRIYGEVLTFGSGDCGQLAHGTDSDEDLIVKYPRIVYSLRDKKVCGIACGGLHNAVYTESGQVYTWGCADDGSLGRGGDENLPALVEGLANETIIGIACGDGQTIAVSTKGEVWGWGSYKDKEGKKWFNQSPEAENPVKDIKKQQNTPIKIVGLANVVDVACGSAFNLALTSDGKLYSWGIGESGELGRYAPPLKKPSVNGDEPQYDLPNIYKYHITPGPMYYDQSPSIENALIDYDSKLKVVSGVKSIGCGSYHSMIVVVGDLVYSCGLNNYGQLGLGDLKARLYYNEVTSLSSKRIISLTGGVHHSLALSSSGEVFAFGRGDSGQLGSNEVSMKSAGDFCERPVRPTFPAGTKLSSISCGGNHNLAITEKGEVYTWGYGDMNALGHGREDDEFLPKKINFEKAKIKNIKVTQVAGGGQHSAVIGEVVTF